MLQKNSALSQLKQKFNDQKIRVEGLIKPQPKGYGFVEVDAKNRYFISARNLNLFFTDDRVSGYLEQKNDKQAFIPESLIKSSTEDFIGKVMKRNDRYFVLPDNRNGIEILLINVDSTINDGDWIQAKLISHPFTHDAKAEFHSFICENENAHLLWLKALSRNQLAISPPKMEIGIMDVHHDIRTDLTSNLFLTIDAETTEDIDDAICVTKNAAGLFQLSIAIADPSAYVLENSSIDMEAQNRLFTSYLPNYSVSMLPNELAYDLCSLQPNCECPALVLNVDIEPDGNIKYDSTNIKLALINSRAKFSYNQVAQLINSAESLDRDNALLLSLKLLHELALIRQAWRKKHTLTFNDRTEYEFKFDENKHVFGVEIKPTLIAHKMVEEAMIIANLSMAHQLAKIGRGIFNCHDTLDERAMEYALTLLEKQEFTHFNKETLSTLDGYLEFRHAITDERLNYQLRHLLKPGEFSFEPKPHFTLGESVYATWTSPIRKYSDLINHRIIKHHLFQTDEPNVSDDLLNRISEKRKHIRLAENELSNIFYAELLKHDLTKQYDAQILTINRGGMRVRIKENGALAFISLSSIKAIHNDVKLDTSNGVIHSNDEIKYQLLDHVKIKISKINEDGSLIAELV